MAKFGTTFFLIAICCCQLATCFDLERDLLGKFRTKRQLKKICSAELYEKGMGTVCTIPTLFSHGDAVKTCLAGQKAATLTVAENVCVWDCVYQAKKWISNTGVLNVKQITTDFTKGLEAAWAPIVPKAIATSNTEASARAAAKLTSGYVTKCKTPAYVFQTRFMVLLNENCPTAKQGANYKNGKAALAVCDAHLIFKSEAEMKAEAAKKIQTQSAAIAAAAKNPAAIAALLPKGFAVPAGVNTADLLAKAKADPAKAMASLPKGVDASMLSKLFG